jgi:hypothetical protein
MILGVQTIDAETASHVLHHFGEGGMKPGSFTTPLIQAIAAADPRNLALLALGFPALVAAVRLAMRQDDGIATLRDIAKGLVP